MKKILFLCLLLMGVLNINAQQYLHYYMNDSTFQGFYTKDISRIYNDTAQTKIKVNNTTVSLNVNDIDSVGVEDIMVTDGNFKGDYRIYEFSYDRAKYGLSKVFVDNRSNVIISKNGDLGANDTILFVSKYYGYQYLMMTDEVGKIRKVFDGKRLIYVDGKFNCIEIFRNSYHVIHNADEAPKAIRPTAAKDIIKPVISIIKKNHEVLEGIADFMGGKGLDFLTSFENIENNPNNRNLFLIKDGLSIAGDIAGICVGLGAEGLTLGSSTLLIVLAAEQLIEDSMSLYKHLFPDEQQLKVFKKYYQDYYGIKVLALAADYVSSDMAELNGSVSTLDKIKGELVFKLQKGDEDTIECVATEDGCQGNFYTYSCYAEGLDWGRRYSYNAVYKCNVDRLHFDYTSSNTTTFRTYSPKAITGVEQSVGKNSAVVGATFAYIPEGASCGVEYEANGLIMEQIVSPSNGIEMEVTLKGLTACTEYNYRAFMKTGEKTIYGTYKTITTTAPDISGTWQCREKIVKRNGEISYQDYSLTLNNDKSVRHSEIEGTNTNQGVIPLMGHWSLGAGGRVYIKICISDISSHNYFSSINQSWKGSINDLENPTQINGRTSTATSTGNGWHEHDAHEFVMTR